MTTHPCAPAATGLPASTFTGPGYYRALIPAAGAPAVHVAYVAEMEQDEDCRTPSPWLAVWLTAPIAGDAVKPVFQGEAAAVESMLIERIETGRSGVTWRELITGLWKLQVAIWRLRWLRVRLLLARRRHAAHPKPDPVRRRPSNGAGA